MGSGQKGGGAHSRLYPPSKKRGAGRMRSRNLKASRQETPTESLRKKAGAEDEHVLEMQIADVSRDGQSTSGLRVVTEEVVRGAGRGEFPTKNPNTMPPATYP